MSPSVTPFVTVPQTVVSSVESHQNEFLGGTYDPRPFPNQNGFVYPRVNRSPLPPTDSYRLRVTGSGSPF